MPTRVQSTRRRQNLEETTSPTRPKEQVEVIKRLEEDIIFGRFALGSRLVEDTLMARYRATRRSVRQGLFQLKAGPCARSVPPMERTADRAT
jgi:DNA-binding GntR family transcriptional regulator